MPKQKNNYQAVVDRIAKGESAAAACRAEGISSGSFSSWKHHQTHGKKKTIKKSRQPAKPIVKTAFSLPIPEDRGQISFSGSGREMARFISELAEVLRG